MSDIKSERPVLSVIVPIYGVEKYLKQCIESICSSSYRELEIILVDDGSYGAEGDICDEYALIDSRIKVVHKENEGLVAARKTGIRLASSEYITFVDGDDFIKQDYYEKMMNRLIEEAADMIAVSFVQYYEDGRGETVLQNIENGVYENDELKYIWKNMNCKNRHYYDYGIWPSTWSKIYKTSLLKKTSTDIPDEIRIGEDSAFTFPYILNCRKIIVDNDITGYFYRYVNDSMTKSMSDSLICESAGLYNYLKQFYSEKEDPDITDQLELFRIYLINLILNKWIDKVTLKDLHLKCAELRNIIETTGFISIIVIPDECDIPKYCRRQIGYISKNEWLKFELLIIVRIIRKRLRKQ